MPAEEAHVIVGRIKGPWGLRGDLRVEVLSDYALRFSPGSVIYLGDQPARVERSRSTDGGLVLKLDLVNDRSAAELLHGRDLTVPQAEVPPLPEGSYYHFQIIGMGVWSQQGDYLGEVEEIIVTGSNDVYVIKGRDRKELLVPALEDVILEVNLQDNRMTVQLPEGLTPEGLT